MQSRINAAALVAMQLPATTLGFVISPEGLSLVLLVDADDMKTQDEHGTPNHTLVRNQGNIDIYIYIDR